MTASSSAQTLARTVIPVGSTAESAVQVDGFFWQPMLEVSTNVERTPLYDSSARLRKPQHMKDREIENVNQPFDYFRLLFPFPALKGIRDATANNWPEAGAGVAPTRGETLKAIGIQLAMALDPIRGSRKDYWATTADPDDLTLPRNYGKRFGISRDRFRDIFRYLRLCHLDDGIESEVSIALHSAHAIALEQVFAVAGSLTPFSLLFRMAGPQCAHLWTLSTPIECRLSFLAPHSQSTS